MENNKRICPNCGSIEPDSHAYCSRCGTKLSTDIAPDENNEERISKKHPVISFIVLLVILYFILSFIISNFLSKIGSEVNNDLLPEETKIDKCSEFDIKRLAIDSFKEKDYYFRYILPKSVANVYLINTEQSSHLLDSNKYYCEGTIEVTSEVNGFQPKEENEDNEYYNLIHQIEESPYKEYLDKYTSYKCDIEYTVENPEGQVRVESSYCGSGKMLDTAPKPQFDCDGICDPKILKEEELEQDTNEDITSNEVHNKENVENKAEYPIPYPTETDNEISNETKIRQSAEQGNLENIQEIQHNSAEE